MQEFAQILFSGIIHGKHLEGSVSNRPDPLDAFVAHDKGP
jgi:hypothetical protein